MQFSTSSRKFGFSMAAAMRSLSLICLLTGGNEQEYIVDNDLVTLLSTHSPPRFDVHPSLCKCPVWCYAADRVPPWCVYRDQSVWQVSSAAQWDWIRCVPASKRATRALSVLQLLSLLSPTYHRHIGAGRGHDKYTILVDDIQVLQSAGFLGISYGAQQIYINAQRKHTQLIT